MKFILTADWHLRGETPRCRRDVDWLETQRRAIRWTVEQARSRNVQLIVLGDIFDSPRTATPVVVMVLQELGVYRNGVLIEAGNHDLPFHSYTHVDECSYGILREHFTELHNAGLAASPFGLDDYEVNARSAFTHQLVFPDEKSRPMEGIGQIAEELAAKFAHAKWIFTGDYHHKFDVQGDGWRVTNPGCLIRHSADMLDYEPAVALVDLDAEMVEWIPVPEFGEVEAAGEALVTDRYLREAAVRTDKIDAFLTAVRTKGAVSLSFRDNLQRKLDDPELPAPIRTEVLGVLNKLNKEK